MLLKQINSTLHVCNQWQNHAFPTIISSQNFGDLSVRKWEATLLPGLGSGLEINLAPGETELTYYRINACQ